MSTDNKNTQGTLSLRSKPKGLENIGQGLVPDSETTRVISNQNKVLMPEPCAGLVIFYDYTWHADFERNGESDKPRPCLVMGVKHNPERPNNPQVAVVPITHKAPAKTLKDFSIHIPKQLGQSVGLDNMRSYIRCNEVNVFDWPGPDLTPIPGVGARKFDYGLIDKDLFNDAQRLFGQIKNKLVVRRHPAFEPEENAL